jgi:hypothetical protein
MAHMTPGQWLEKYGLNKDVVLYKDINDYVPMADILRDYHDYTLEQAVEDVKVITRLIETDEDSIFNEIPVYMGIDKNSILQHKFIK